MAIHFKLGTFLMNSVGRYFVKSTQQIVGGQEGGGLGVDHHHRAGLDDKGSIYTDMHNYQELLHLNIQKTNFYPIPKSV